jgi:hypothetical protein
MFKIGLGDSKKGKRDIERVYDSEEERCCVVKICIIFFF